MKKAENWLTALIILLSITLITLYFVYSNYYLPRAKAYSTYLEIYQEYGENEIKTINISSINHHLVVKKSNTDKIKIDYYQKMDNSNTYSVNNGVLSLDIIEKGEEVDNLLFSSAKKINVITIYIPENKSISLSYNSITGNGDIDDVMIGNLSISNVTGEINLSNAEINNLLIKTNGGNVLVEHSSIINLDVKNVSGEVSFSINDDLNKYHCHFSTDYGTIIINEEKMMENDLQGNQYTLKEYQQKGSEERRFVVETIRGSISICYPISTPEDLPEENQSS